MPLHFAVDKLNHTIAKDMVPFLVEKMGANINQANEDGLTPLEVLLSNNYHPNADLMLVELLQIYNNSKFKFYI